MTGGVGLGRGFFRVLSGGCLTSSGAACSYGCEHLNVTAKGMSAQ